MDAPNYHAAYRRTFFLAKGFIGMAETPLDEYKRTVSHHEKEIADIDKKPIFHIYADD